MSYNNCRICFKKVKNVIKYCDCVGSNIPIHFECLKKWIIERNYDLKCEICNQEYEYIDIIEKRITDCSEYFVRLILLVFVSNFLLLVLFLHFDKFYNLKNNYFFLIIICLMNLLIISDYLKKYSCSYKIKYEIRLNKGKLNSDNILYVSETYSDCSSSVNSNESSYLLEEEQV